MNDDRALIDQYRQGSHDAFVQLVRRHIDWVYSVALRRVRDAHLAEDVTQAVFAVLFQKPPRLKVGQALSVWLFTVVHHASLQTLRSESRRRHHETEAAKMKSRTGTSESPQWEDLAPHLDELVGQLGSADHQTVLQRFYEQKSFSEMAAMSGTSEEAARKRVSRAVKRLRALFERRGSAVPAVALPSLLMEHVTLPAPGALVETLTSAAAPASMLARDVLTALAWTKIKLVTAVLAAAIVFVGMGAAAVLQQASPDAPPPAVAAAPIPMQVEQMIHENTRSLGKLSRLIAELEESTQLWREGQTSRQHDLVRLTVDGNKVREDRQAAPDEVPEQRTMQFAMAEGVAVMDSNMAARRIRTAELSALYTPGNTLMAVIPGKEKLPFGRDSFVLHEFLSCKGTPLEEKVLELTKAGYAAQVKDDRIDGLECRLLEWDFPKTQMALKIWIAPAQGHLIKRVEQFLRGERVERWTADLKAYGDVYCIAQVAWTQWARGQPSRTTLLTVKSLDLNPQIDPAIFTLDGLGIPEGTTIQDRRGESMIQWRYVRP